MTSSDLNLREVAEQVVISHPASWGKYRRELLHRLALGLEGSALLLELLVAGGSDQDVSHVRCGSICAPLLGRRDPLRRSERPDTRGEP